MNIAEFGLERWFAKYEHEADLMLAESGIRSLDASRFDLDPGRLGYVIPTNGDPQLRASIGDRYDRDAEEVCFTCGTQEANFLTFVSVLGGDRGSHAVVVTPTYQALTAVPEAFGEVTRVGLEPPRWKLDPAAVRDVVRDDTALVVINNPNNPTGRYHSEATMREIYEIAVDHDAYLLCDEVYRLLADDPQPPIASYGDHGISTTSLTKAYGLAGLRFGWIAGPREVIDAAWRWKDYTTISPGRIGQHVARQALGRREKDILRENRTLARENRDLVTDWVDRHGLEWYVPVGVNGFVTIPDGFADAETFCRTVVEEEGIVLAPGTVFGFPDRFRIGFGLPTPELEEGLHRVHQVIRDRGQP